MIVCFCIATTEREISEVIESGANSLEQVGHGCGAGTGCGSCHDYIAEMLSKRQQGQETAVVACMCRGGNCARCLESDEGSSVRPAFAMASKRAA